MLLSSQGDAFPIGTILAYTGALSKIPAGWHLCDGTAGTPNLIGRFLEGVSSSVGVYKNAGLPNITGQFIADRQGGDDIDIKFISGAFKEYQRFSTYIHVGNPDDWGSIYNFDASLSNPIYGKSTTVQPASFTVYYIMKIR